MDPVLAVRNISKTFSDDAGPPAKIFGGRAGKPLTVLTGITFDVAAGEIFVLLGPSGSGKSTLLRIMSGLEPSSAGEVHYGGGLTNRDISFVFQQFALLPWLTVRENITLGLVARRVAGADQERIVTQELKQFGLEKFDGAHPRELSGGMRQRVGIARALATSPKIIFMDEPFSELDSFTAEELRRDLLSIWAERRPTIVMVTHLVSEAIQLADRIAVLTSQPGRIERILENRLGRPRALRSLAFFTLEDELRKLVRP